MPLVDLLYRCPICGEEAMRSEGRAAACDSCGHIFAHVGRGGRVSVREPGGGRWEAPIAELVAGDPGEDRAPMRSAGSDDLLSVPPRGEAAVSARFARDERPIRYRRSLLGFVEQTGTPSAGTLRLDGKALSFTDGTGTATSWPLEEIRAIQTSSSVLQVSPPDGGVVSFRFDHDSPRRWEDLLKGALRRAWRRQGRGEIVEFQPRIRSH